VKTVRGATAVQTGPQVEMDCITTDPEQAVPDKIAVTEEGGVAGPAFVPPKWRKPAPLGYGNAIDSVGTVGSALLAGFSLASVIVVTSAAGQFRWPGAAVLALAAAAVALIASVQFTYNTRQFLWSGADVRDWWPELQENSELETRLRRSRPSRSAGGRSGRSGRAPRTAPVF
jgi:hypothetical protein